MYVRGFCCCCCLLPSTIFKTVSKNTNVGYQVSIESAQKLYWVAVAYCFSFFFLRSCLCIRGWSWTSDPSVPLPNAGIIGMCHNGSRCPGLQTSRALFVLLSEQTFGILSEQKLPLCLPTYFSSFLSFFQFALSLIWLSQRGGETCQRSGIRTLVHLIPKPFHLWYLLLLKLCAVNQRTPAV